MMMLGTKEATTITDSPPNRCNMCLTEVQGQAYRTTCRHLYCDTCAFSHFSSQRKCAICESPLSEDGVIDLCIGKNKPHPPKLTPQAVLPINILTIQHDIVSGMGSATAGSFADQVFQEIYKDSGLGNTAVALMSAAEVLEGAQQFALEAQRATRTAITNQLEATKLKHENGRLQIQHRTSDANLKRVEAKLALRDREHLDLQEAYKEKMRKCIAWEKAYAQLKNQSQARTKAIEPVLATTQEINDVGELYHGTQRYPPIHHGGLMVGPTSIEQQQQPVVSGLSAQPSGLRSQQLAPHLAPGLPGAPRHG